jgi:hypothetical protein
LKLRLKVPALRRSPAVPHTSEGVVRLKLRCSVPHAERSYGRMCPSLMRWPMLSSVGSQLRMQQPHGVYLRPDVAMEKPPLRVTDGALRLCSSARERALTVHAQAEQQLYSRAAALPPPPRTNCLERLRELVAERFAAGYEPACILCSPTGPTHPCPLMGTSASRSPLSQLHGLLLVQLF